jgi:hypothetical protein
MLRRRIFFITAIISVALVAATIGYLAYVRDGARSDEFAAYAALLAHLSHESPPTTFVLADMSSKLIASDPQETWIPKELRPYPPEKAAPPDDFVSFCGRWCGHEFMRRNLKAYPLNPGSKVRFPFDVLHESSEVTARERGKQIVSVTRPGFDFWHYRAVLTYSLDCSSDGTSEQIAVICVQTGGVLLERVNGDWHVRSYSAIVF